MLIRRLARPLIAASFIHGGIAALRDTEGHAKAAQPFLEKTVSKFRDSIPPQIPTDPESLIQFDGVVKVGGGVMLALGKSPRLAAVMLIGSVIPTTLSSHAFWEYQDREQRNAQMIQFLKNLAVLGGLMITAVDTEGKPSVVYKTRRRAAEITR